MDAVKLLPWFPARYIDRLCAEVEDAEGYGRAFAQLCLDWHTWKVTTAEFAMSFEVLQAAAWAAGVDADLLAMDSLLVHDKLSSTADSKGFPQ